MDRNTSALSTTSVLLSIKLLLPPGRMVIGMTMLWRKTLTAFRKNELIHTRTWNDVVDVEIATFEWVTWWNATRLHQGLGYRTPAEVESEFCTSNPKKRNTRHQGKCLGTKPATLYFCWLVGCFLLKIRGSFVCIAIVGCLLVCIRFSSLSLYR